MAERKVLVDLDVDGKVTSDQFIKNGGTSSQFLKADGSVDSTSYAQPTSIYSVASEAAMLALTTTQGDIVKRTDESKTYMDNGGDAYGSELLTYPDFNTLAYPWSWGSWSYMSPTISGGIVTLEVDGGNYPSVNPRIEQSLTVTTGEDYKIECRGDGNGHDIQVLAVDPNNGYALIDSFDITSNGSYSTGSMIITAPSAGLIVQILVKGSDGDIAYADYCSVKQADAMAKFTYFASF